MKITNRIVSADNIIMDDACYDDDEVRRLVPSPVPLSAILELDIPDVDKLWTSCLVLCPRERTWLAAQYARTALPYTTDERVLQCIETCERYAAGEATYEELLQGRRAAAYAASEAADHAARRRESAALAAAYAADAAEDAADAPYAAYAARAAVNATPYAAADARMLRIFKEALT